MSTAAYSPVMNACDCGSGPDDDGVNVFDCVREMFFPSCAISDHPYWIQRIEAFLIFWPLLVLTVVFLLATLLFFIAKLILFLAICGCEEFEYWLWPLNPPDWRS